MNKPQSLLTFLTFCILATQTVCCQEEPDFCDQIAALNTTLEENHYKAKAVDDAFSSAVFELFITSLDYEKNVFTKEDIETFNTEKDSLDDFIKGNNCAFIDRYSRIIKEKTQSRITFLSELKTEKLDYNSLDSISYRIDKEYTYAKNSKRLDKFWTKKIRLNILNKIYEKDSTLTYLKANFSEFEPQIKDAIITKEICLLEDLLSQDIDLLTKERFLNSITQYQDPNSSFFNYSEKESFVNSLSSNSLSFGIITDKNEKGDIIVAYIQPGGAAFLDQRIEANDVVLGLTSKKETLDLNCVSNEHITGFISENETIIFKVKKNNGKILDIELTKTVSKVEENSVLGYVINNEFGYIKISSFYTSFESSNKQGLANDVAKEIYKLKKEHIKGLILDLRFNGGGSVGEAIELVGMFIDRGPITILKQKATDAETVKDFNRGSIFTKPIVVIVNSFSASASELFAAAMQDYNRAIIVGTNTFGKATGQVIIPIDYANEALGYTKVTAEKFYRVTGKSHQSTGVIPDVLFPSFYDDFEIGEQYNPHTLKTDSIPFSLKHRPLEFKNKDVILTNAQNRVIASEGLQSLKKMNAFYLKNYLHKNTSFSLNLEEVYSHNDKIIKGWNALETDFNELEKTDPLVVSNSKSTQQIIQFNDEDSAHNTLILNEIATDFYIKEATNILTDPLNN
ncbi:carboxy terminal-processing peptidase [bacterium]|nr:carboxy terminal-processing peptidase [bacterium]